MLKKNSLLPVSPTALINSIAQEKSAQGIKIYNLSAGEPKLPVHQYIVQAVLKAMSENKTFYPPTAGIAALRLAATHWMNSIYGSDFNQENCLVVNGGKFGIYLLLQSLLKKSDEVIFASPYWVSYPAITEIFQGKPNIITTKASYDWKIRLSDLKKRITTKTKVLILNNAANPTGTTYTKEELSNLLSYAYRKKIFVISDEVYSGLVYNDMPYVSCAYFKEYADRVAVIQSCSKNFAMTGWRVGFVFAAQKLISQLTALVSQSTSGITTVSQYAALAAFQHHDTINQWVKKMMRKRRDIVLNAMKQHFSVDIPTPSSSLYIFMSLKKLGIACENSAEFCQHALAQGNIAMVPGIAFGQEGYIRLSFGAEEKELNIAIQKLAEFVQQVNANAC